jgi:hypothetical protein
MTGSKDSSDVSPSNIIEPIMETLSAKDQQDFEEHRKQLIKEFLANFKVDRKHKVIQQRTTNLASSDLLQLPQGKRDK